MKKRVLITGPNGYLGTYLVRHLAERNTFTLCLWHEDILGDYTLPPVDAVVHLAGLPNSYKGPAEDITRVNFDGVVNVAERSVGAHFILLSSDYVFSGRDPDKIYTEDEPYGATTVYGRAKARAEQFLLASGERVTTLRAALLYGYDHPRRQNFFRLLADKLDRGEPVELFTDVGSCPTYVPDLCRVIERVVNEERVGTFHTCGGEYFSRYDLGLAYCEVKDVDARLVIPIPKPCDVMIPKYLRMARSVQFADELNTSLKEGLRLWAKTS